MFEKLKKAFLRDPDKAPEAPASQYSERNYSVSQWAATHGFAVAIQGAGQTVSLKGKVKDRPWVLEVGKPSRNYIEGEEVRGRAELGLNEDISVLVINRSLKESLESRAYNMIAGDLQTSADPNLPEEMRWLAMYDEVGWDSLPREFWNRYAVLADQRNNALAWVDPQLAQMLLEWPDPGPGDEVPFMILLLRGKAYLRMQYSPAVMPVLEHAAQIFTSSSESALGAFR